MLYENKPSKRFEGILLWTRWNTVCYAETDAIVLRKSKVLKMIQKLLRKTGLTYHKKLHKIIDRSVALGKRLDLKYIKEIQGPILSTNLAANGR